MAPSGSARARARRNGGSHTDAAARLVPPRSRGRVLQIIHNNTQSASCIVYNTYYIILYIIHIHILSDPRTQQPTKTKSIHKLSTEHLTSQEFDALRSLFEKDRWLSSIYSVIVIYSCNTPHAEWHRPHTPWHDRSQPYIIGTALTAAPSSSPYVTRSTFSQADTQTHYSYEQTVILECPCDSCHKMAAG